VFVVRMVMPLVAIAIVVGGLLVAGCNPQAVFPPQRVDVAGLELDFVDLPPGCCTRVILAKVVIRNPNPHPIEFDLANIRLKYGQQDVGAKVISRDRGDTVVSIEPDRGKRVARRLAHPGPEFELMFELSQIPHASKTFNGQFYVCCVSGAPAAPNGPALADR